MSLAPSASDLAALTSTRKSLIMERMGDKDIVKRAFKTFQKSYDFTSSVNEQRQLSKSGAIHVEKTRVQKNSKAGVIDTKTRRDSLKPKAKSMQGSRPVRSLPKGSSEKVLW
ncbi:Uncharacterized protein Rs2_36754 [Raphanus sativus]|nr:Uncharacterized protein Rs2_36754 [Raphanus sativus]